MELRGTLKSWDDGKGFGFIRPEQGGAEIFAHASVVHGERRPLAGDRVLYVVGRDARGRLRAEHVRLDGPPMLDRPSIRQRPAGPQATTRAAAPGVRQARGGVRNLPLKLLLFAALGVLPLLGSLYRLGSVLPLAVYATASLLTFFLYWRDKHSALRGRWRTPESTLHVFELAGGWPGALLAQQVFRHKTRKLGYQLPFWLIVALHQAFWIDLLFVGGAVTRERWDWLLRLL